MPCSIKNPPAMQKIQATRVQSLGQEDPLEEEGPLEEDDPLEEDMATQCTPSILAWRIPWTEEPGGLQSTGSQRVGQKQLSTHSGEEQFIDLDE